jgi:hypothetical protein
MAQLSQQREMFFYKEKKSTCSNANGNEAKKGKKNQPIGSRRTYF